MRIAVILTVLNEGESIRAVLDSLRAQTRAPDEVVVADGGSSDSTLSVLREYQDRLPLKVIETPGANISQGRNAAIRVANADIVAATDAGVRCAPDWLEQLMRPFTPGAPAPAGEKEVAAAAGFFQSDPASVFEMALGATVLPEARDVNPSTYLPSSRSVAYRKAVWETVGGYPEWLDFCEDVVFNLKVREKYGPFVFVPEALVHFQPRGSLRAFFRQYYQYARGDGKAGLFPRLHLVRYLTYLGAAPLLIYAALTVSPWLWLVGLAAGLAYLRLPLRRAARHLPGLRPLDVIRLLLYLPLIRVTGDVAKMIGYPAGVWWRMQLRRNFGAF